MERCLFFSFVIFFPLESIMIIFSINDLHPIMCQYSLVNLCISSHQASSFFYFISNQLRNCVSLYHYLCLLWSNRISEIPERMASGLLYSRCDLCAGRHLLSDFLRRRNPGVGQGRWNPGNGWDGQTGGR